MTDISCYSPINIMKFVLPYYNLQDSVITIVKSKDTDKQRVVFKISSPDTSFCLKKVYYSVSELLFVYSALEWLYRNNVNVPKIIPTIKNGRYVEYNKGFFILTPWIEGERCDFHNETHVIKCAMSLAKLHNTTKNFIPIDGCSMKENYNDLYKYTLKHLEQLVELNIYASEKNDTFSKIFLEFYQKNLYLAEEALKISAKINNKNLSISLCHGDYVNKNIIFDNRNIPWTIDFDKCKKGYSAYDIGYFLRRYLRRDSILFNKTLAYNFLKEYNKINKLTPSDLQFIVSYIAFPQKFFKISKVYLKNTDNSISKDILLSNLKKSSKNIDYQINLVNHLKKELTLSNWTI